MLAFFQRKNGRFARSFFKHEIQEVKLLTAKKALELNPVLFFTYRSLPIVVSPIPPILSLLVLSVLEFAFSEVLAA